MESGRIKPLLRPPPASSGLLRFMLVILEKNMETAIVFRV